MQDWKQTGCHFWIGSTGIRLAIEEGSRDFSRLVSARLFRYSHNQLVEEYRMHPLAEESNANLPERIRTSFEEGSRDLFPEQRILGQSAEAKGKRISDDRYCFGRRWLTHASTGSCRAGRCCTCVFPYAPSYGKPGLRDLWRSMLREKNPSREILQSVARLSPMLSRTHSRSLATSLLTLRMRFFCRPLLGELPLGLRSGHQAKIETYPTFVDGGYNAGTY